MNKTDEKISAAYHPDILSWIDDYFVKKNADEKTLKQIYIAMGRVLLPRFRRIIKTNVIDAEDVYNETWLAIISPDTAEYDSRRGPFIGYFIAIAKNLIMNWNYRKENEANVKLDEIKTEICEALEPNRDFFNQELKVMFYEQINKLTDMQREIIVFRNLGFSFREIASVFGLPEETLRQRMTSAKKHLAANPDTKKIFELMEEN